MDTLRQQLTFAMRALIARPSYSLIVIATLALGIGANTAIFSILHALVLRSLPVADPARLVVVMRNDQPSQQYPLFVHFQQHSKTVDVLAFRTATWRFTAGQKDERITGARLHTTERARRFDRHGVGPGCEFQRAFAGNI